MGLFLLLTVRLIPQRNLEYIESPGHAQARHLIFLFTPCSAWPPVIDRVKDHPLSPPAMLMTAGRHHQGKARPMMAGTPTFAVPPSFLGVSRTDRDADYVVAGIPMDIGTTNRSGTRDGPAAIRRASRMLTDGDASASTGSNRHA